MNVHPSGHWIILHSLHILNTYSQSLHFWLVIRIYSTFELILTDRWKLYGTNVSLSLSPMWSCFWLLCTLCSRCVRIFLESYYSYCSSIIITSLGIIFSAQRHPNITNAHVWQILLLNMAKKECDDRTTMVWIQDVDCIVSYSVESWIVSRRSRTFSVQRIFNRNINFFHIVRS